MLILTIMCNTSIKIIVNNLENYKLVVMRNKFFSPKLFLPPICGNFPAISNPLPGTSALRLRES